MNKFKFIILAISTIILTNCNSDNHEFPIDKRYWDLNDYHEAVLELNYGYEKDEKLPTFDDPETRIIVEKLTDETNFEIVLGDDELGLKHRNDIADKFFDEWRSMNDIYNALDRKDQYLYGKEMLAVWQFGLGLQLKSFKLGNDQIKERADDPDSFQVKNNVDSNIKILINNFIIYLDHINNENAFTEEGKAKLAEGINNYFPKLIEQNPDANYSSMKNKAELMDKKSESVVIKKALNDLIQLIDSNKKNE